MEKTFRAKMLGYLLVSAVGFIYLVTPKNAGAGVPVFALVQFACLWFLAPKKKPLLLFVPIFILALNSFVSANGIWRVPNFFVALALYSVMALLLAGDFPFREPSARFLTKTLDNCSAPSSFSRRP